MNTLKSLLVVSTLFMALSFSHAQSYNANLLTRSWVFDIDSMVAQFPEEEKLEKKQIMNKLKVVYSFESSGGLQIDMMGEKMFGESFWQFSEDETKIYMTGSDGKVEEFYILHLDAKRLTINGENTGKLYFIPFKKSQ